MRNLFKNQLGFTLPEIMIGSAILAGVALAGATIFRNQARSQAKIEHDQILTGFHSALAKTLSDVHNCNATFQDYYGANKIPADGVAFTANPRAVFLCDGGATCNADFDAGGVTRLGSYFIRPGDWIDEGSGASRQIWRLTDVTYMNALTDTGALRLRFIYTINPKIDNRTVAKDLNVSLRFAKGPPNKFLECFNDQESAINNMQNDLCTSLYPAGVATTGAIVQWDADNQSCVLVGQPAAPLKNCTAAGLMVEGIRSDGTVHCKPLTEGFNPNPAINSTDCPATSKVQLSWDGTRVRVICVP